MNSAVGSSGRPTCRAATIELHVDRTVKAFMAPERWLALLGIRHTARGRSRFRHGLSTDLPLRPECATDVTDRTMDELLRTLKARGAPTECVLVKDGLSSDELADLDTALARVLASASGALVSCIPGELALAQTGDGRRYLLTPHPE